MGEREGRRGSWPLHQLPDVGVEQWRVRQLETVQAIQWNLVLLKSSFQKSFNTMVGQQQLSFIQYLEVPL